MLKMVNEACRLRLEEEYLTPHGLFAAGGVDEEGYALTRGKKVKVTPAPPLPPPLRVIPLH